MKFHKRIISVFLLALVCFVLSCPYCDSKADTTVFAIQCDQCDGTCFLERTTDWGLSYSEFVTEPDGTYLYLHYVRTKIFRCNQNSGHTIHLDEYKTVKQFSGNK